MGQERGMTVAELIEELSKLPQGREVRFLLDNYFEEPLARQDIKTSNEGARGKVLLKPTVAVGKAEDADDDDGERCRYSHRCVHFREA